MIGCERSPLCAPSSRASAASKFSHSGNRPVRRAVISTSSRDELGDLNLQNATKGGLECSKRDSNWVSRDGRARRCVWPCLKVLDDVGWICLPDRIFDRSMEGQPRTLEPLGVLKSCGVARPAGTHFLGVSACPTDRFRPPNRDP